jgi:hypothetical protein
MGDLGSGRTTAAGEEGLTAKRCMPSRCLRPQ